MQFDFVIAFCCLLHSAFNARILDKFWRVLWLYCLGGDLLYVSVNVRDNIRQSPYSETSETLSLLSWVTTGNTGPLSKSSTHTINVITRRGRRQIYCGGGGYRWEVRHAVSGNPIVLPLLVYLPTTTRVDWYIALFSDFRKQTHCCRSGKLCFHEFNFKKIGKFVCAMHARQNFIYQKITETI